MIYRKTWYSKITLSFLIPAFFSAFFSSCAETTPVDQAPQKFGELFSESAAASTFSRAVVEAGLVAFLNEPGPFTVFSPGNEAFEELFTTLGTDKESFLARDDLETVVKSHIVTGELSLAALTDGATFKTLAGGLLRVEVRGDEVFLNSDAKVVGSYVDWQIINGEYHIVNRVLLPPEFKAE